MKERLLDFERDALKQIEAAPDAAILEAIRIRTFGRKGQFSSLLKEVTSLPSGSRPEMGRLANQIKERLTAVTAEKQGRLLARAREEELAREMVDVTLPGRCVPVGRKHPLTLIYERIKEIFMGMGFEIARGPEIEMDYYNFEALNIPKDHPARDMQDTFYLEGDWLLRTHTSPLQVRVMESRLPPLSVICPGAVYRRDSDLSHTPMFHQVEGFVVDRDVSFADLKAVLTIFAREMFGPETAVRFRPSYFPFTEPSAEVDIRCVICQGKGCRVCSEKGWLEILGAGMIHPQVFRMVNYDPEEWTGWAFGMGVERIAMLVFGINDIRLFFDSDLRFLRQFGCLY